MAFSGDELACVDCPSKESGTPSTINNGSVAALTEPLPRIVTRNAPPGLPEAEVTVTPAARPWGKPSVLCREMFSISSELTLVIEPVSSDRKSTRLNSSHVAISYAVFCLKKNMKHHDDHAHAEEFH